MDPEKRRLYDETGEYDDNEAAPIDLDDTYNYYRAIYPRLKVEDIDNYSLKYRNGEEEKEDLIQFYNENKGDIKLILENIPLSRNEDAERFVKIYDELIKEGIIKKYKKYEKTKNIIKLLDEDEEEVEEAEKQIDDLKKQIMLRHQNKGGKDNFANFAAKFGVDLYNCEEPKIDEAEFEKNKKQLNRKRAKK